MRFAAVAGIVLVLLTAGWFTVRHYVSPARQLGWQPEATNAPPAGNEAVTPPRAPVAGFSRFLPADTEAYVALLQAGPLWRRVRDSHAWRSVAETEEAKKVRAEIDKELEPERAKLPPEVQETLDLLADAFDTEVCFALAGDASERTVDLGAALLWSGLLLVPTQFPPESGEAQELEAWRQTLVPEWLEAVKRARVPSGLVAARVSDPGRFDKLIYTLIDKARTAASEAAAKGATPSGPTGTSGVAPVVAGAPPATNPFEKIYAKTALGALSFHRFTFRVGDHADDADLDRGLDRLSQPPETLAEARQALRDFTFVLHVGFVGPYFTVAFGADDAFLAATVARFEGREPENLAAAERFTFLRERTDTATTGVSFVDLERGRAAIQARILPILDRVKDPDLLMLLGVPPPLLGMVDQYRTALSPAPETDYLRIEALQWLEDGVKGERRSTLAAASSLPPGDGPASVAAVPADALAYTSARDASWDGTWGQIRFQVQMELAQLDTLEQQTRDNPRYAEMIAQRRQAFREILDPLEQDLVPHLKGAMTAILGAPVTLELTGADVEIRGLSIPSAAIVVGTEDPEAVVRGLQRFVPAFVNSFTGGGRPGAPKPPELLPREVGGRKVYTLDVSEAVKSGFEPHVAVHGKSLILSSSLALTDAVCKAADGAAPDIRTSPAHRAMETVLRTDAHDALFVDGARAADLFASLSEGIFSLVEKEQAGKFAADDREKFAQGRRFTATLAKVLRVHRGMASATVREGAVDVQRQWLHLADLPAEGGK